MKTTITEDICYLNYHSIDPDLFYLLMWKHLSADHSYYYCVSEFFFSENICNVENNAVLIVEHKCMRAL